MVPFAFWIPLWITFMGYAKAVIVSQCIFNLFISLINLWVQPRSHGKDTGPSPVGTTK